MCVKVITVFSGGSGEGPVKETGDYFRKKKSNEKFRSHSLQFPSCYHCINNKDNLKVLIGLLVAFDS